MPQNPSSISFFCRHSGCTTATATSYTVSDWWVWLASSHVKNIQIIPGVHWNESMMIHSAIVQLKHLLSKVTELVSLSQTYVVCGCQTLHCFPLELNQSCCLPWWKLTSDFPPISPSNCIWTTQVLNCTSLISMWTPCVSVVHVCRAMFMHSTAVSVALSFISFLCRTSTDTAWKCTTWTDTACRIVTVSVW